MHSHQPAPRTDRARAEPGAGAQPSAAARSSEGATATGAASPAIPPFAVAILAALALFLVVAPNFDVLPALGYYDGKRVLQLVLLAAVIGILLASRGARQAWLAVFGRLPAWSRWSLGAVMAGGAVSALAGGPAGTGDYSLADVGLYTGLVVLAVAVAAAARALGRRADRLLMVLVLAAIGLYAFRYLTRYAVAIYVREPIFADALIANFAHLRFLGQWLTWTLPLVAVAPVLLRDDARLRWTALAVSALAWTLTLLSGTRGTLFAVAAALILVPLLLGRPGRRWMRQALVAAAAGALLYAASFSWVEVIHQAQGGAERLAEVGATGRLHMWRMAAELAGDRPLLGIGPQRYALHGDVASHPHNALMQWAAEWGIASTLLVLVLASGGLVAWIRRCRRRGGGAGDDRALVDAALTATLLAGSAHAMVSGIIVMPLSQVCLALVAGWVLARYQDGRPAAATAGGAAQAALALTAAASLALVGHVAVRDAPRMQQAVEMHEASGGLFMPRFWRLGQIARYPEY